MSDEVKSFREYLACDIHGDRTAQQVCGECGKPVCDECSTTVHDITLTHFESTGWQKLGAALLLVIVVPVLLFLTGIGASLVASIRKLLFPGKFVPLRMILVESSILLGLGFLPPLWYRGGEGTIDLDLLVRRGNQRVVCDECSNNKSSQNVLYYAVTAVAGLLALIGFYLAFLGGTVGALPIAALGGAVYLSRDAAITGLANALES